jgi:hypothetical protein
MYLYAIIVIYLGLAAYSAAASSIPLSILQQGQIRRILSNAQTPSLIRLKTMNVVFEKYQGWSFHECRMSLAKYGCKRVPDELYQYASHGLLKAIHHYDWTRNTSFTRYAKKYVMGSVYRGMNTIYRTRNKIDFVNDDADWIFDVYGKKYDYRTPTPDETYQAKTQSVVELEDIMKMLDPDERHLFMYVYGHLLDGSKARSVKEICELMCYGSGETYRIHKNRMMGKWVGEPTVPPTTPSLFL